MSPPPIDAIVVGLGGAGAATAYFLARSGRSVLALEQFELVHAKGSSHGGSRIFRSAYYEGSTYVPLVRHAQQRWFELQQATKETIVQRTGGLFLGPPDGSLVRGSSQSAKEWGLPHEVLRPTEIRARYPMFAVNDGEVALWEPNAGVLVPEACLRAMIEGARGAGAEIRAGERVTRWTSGEKGVTVETDRTSYHATSLVLCGGPWTASLVPELAPALRLERQVTFWFRTKDGDRLSPGRMPVFIWQTDARRMYYGVPDLGEGVKVATEDGLEIPSPEAFRSLPDQLDLDRLSPFLRSRLPALDPTPRKAVPCVYTNAPDHRFVIGAHPERPNVFVVSACSGHGFKFAIAVGEVAAALAMGASTGFDLGPFNPERLWRT